MVMRKSHWIRSAVSAMAVALCLAGVAEASESGILSARAQRSFNEGKFAKGYRQLERALLASRKEADLRSEGRVLIDMAQIRSMSLDLDLADSLLSIVRTDALDKNTKVQFTKVQVSIANNREDYMNAVPICKSMKEDILKGAEETTQTAFYGECAIAFAGEKRLNAKDYLEQVGKLTDKKSGYYTYVAARVAHLMDKSDADSLYKVAEKKSIQGSKPYMTSTILYHHSKLDGVSARGASDMKLRCKNAFELMGLPNNAKRCEE